MIYVQLCIILNDIFVFYIKKYCKLVINFQTELDKAGMTVKLGDYNFMNVLNDK